jgi:hypothetical protein
MDADVTVGEVELQEAASQAPVALSGGSVQLGLGTFRCRRFVLRLGPCPASQGALCSADLCLQLICNQPLHRRRPCLRRASARLTRPALAALAAPPGPRVVRPTVRGYDLATTTITPAQRRTSSALVFHHGLSDHSARHLAGERPSAPPAHRGCLPERRGSRASKNNTRTPWQAPHDEPTVPQAHT